MDSNLSKYASHSQQPLPKLHELSLFQKLQSYRTVNCSQGRGMNLAICESQLCQTSGFTLR